MYDFVLGRTHSHPGLHAVVRRPQAVHPWSKGFSLTSKVLLGLALAAFANVTGAMGCRTLIVSGSPHTNL